MLLLLLLLDPSSDSLLGKGILSRPLRVAKKSLRVLFVRFPHSSVHLSIC